jgi:hypothetical protein
LMVWVHNKVGQALSGWRSYEKWANAPGGTQDEYLFDEEVRVHDRTRRTTMDCR